MAATLENVLKDLITGLSAVAALTGTVRTDWAAQKDPLPFILIGVDRETPWNDLSGKGGLIKADVRIRCCAATRTLTRQMTDALRTNGTTPGTGLEGYSGTVDGVAIGELLWDHSEFDYVPYEDGTDNGYYVIDAVYQCDYAVAT